MMVKEKVASEILGLPLGTLRQWRTRKMGPIYYKLCGAVRYDVTDLERFKLNAQKGPSAAPESREPLAVPGSKKGPSPEAVAEAIKLRMAKRRNQ